MFFNFLFSYSPSCLLFSVLFLNKHDIFFKFCVYTFLFVFVNSIRFATCLNQMSCNSEKTDSETKKSNRKCFPNKNVFNLNQKHLLVFQTFRLLKKHEGNKWRNTKNLIKNFRLLFCFSRFARASQNSQNSQKNTCVIASFLIKLKSSGLFKI